jgi:hypothetical protein
MARDGEKSLAARGETAAPKGLNVESGQQQRKRDRNAKETRRERRERREQTP